MWIQNTPVALVMPLFHAFPEIAEEFNDNVADSYDEELGYSLYGFWADSLRVPVRRVLNGEETEERSNALFSWFDDLAQADDRYVRNFLKTEVMELIGDDPKWVDYSRGRLGPAAAQLFLSAERGIGRTLNLPFP